MSDATPATTRILVHGASGRMGAALLRLLPAAAPATLVAAISRRGGTSGGVPIEPTERMTQVPGFDVAIDFSLPDAFDPILDLCLQRGAALVSGTTGLADSQFARLQAASVRIPIVWAPNFSIGAAVLASVVEHAARALQGWDVDIVESHHANKKDAPSGTAVRLGEAAQSGGAVTVRYASLRAGDIVGDHLVQFTGAGERLELIHRATDRDVFARGALRAALWLAGMPAGRYRVADMLGLVDATQ